MITDIKFNDPLTPAINEIEYRIREIQQEQFIEKCVRIAEDANKSIDKYKKLLGKVK